MSEHLDLGKKGEKIAVDYLINKGYLILETNWRYRRSEIDIIVKKDNILIFVEVKTRSNAYYARPESFVTHKKEKMMIDAASAYMIEVGHEWEIRFDIVSVIYHNQAHQTIDHFEDAFFPGWGN